MNDDPCKEERERYNEANIKLDEIIKRIPGLRPPTTEIHNQPDSKIPILKPPTLEAIEGWNKDREKAEQEWDKANKEFNDCKNKHRKK